MAKFHNRVHLEKRLCQRLKRSWVDHFHSEEEGPLLALSHPVGPRNHESRSRQLHACANRTLSATIFWSTKCKQRTKRLIELRKGQRIRSYIAGTIAFNDRKTTLSCLVCNMSARGVGVEVEQAALLPHQFDFILPSKSVSFSARPRWRTAGAAGIEFLSRPQSVAAVPLDMSMRLRSLERERALLRRRLTTMTGSIL